MAKIVAIFLSAALGAASLLADSYELKVASQVTRPWVAPELWTTPMMDWQLSQGRIEIVQGGSGHDLQLLTHQMKSGNGTVRMSARMGSLRDHSKEKNLGAVGFRFAIAGAMPEEYRSNLFGSSGINAGITTEGKLFVGNQFSNKTLPTALLKDVLLEFEASCKGNQATVTLVAKAGDGSGGEQGRFTTSVKANPMQGNIGLFAGPLPSQSEGNQNRRRGGGASGDFRFWFKDWKASGSKIEEKAAQTFGPLLWSQYTVDKGILKMTAHVAPVGKSENQKVVLSVKDGNSWKPLQTQSMDPLSRTVHFRIEKWDDTKDAPYQLSFDYQSSQGKKTDLWDGVIRRDPTDQQSISIAALSCMVDYAFPNQYIAANLVDQDPDLIFFAGDQIYESVGGFPVVRARTEGEVPRAALNYLQKYWLFGWSFRDVLKDRPSVIIPDDHDVYHGNIWGKGGMKMPDGGSTSSTGGYNMHAKWVNMVQRTQVSHLPDPYDPTPVKQGITVYYTELNVGGVSFAILEDRKFKSSPGDALDKPVAGSTRLDHVTDPSIDTKILDKPGLELLGKRQLKFLDDWAADWTGDTLKVVLSQSPFASVATTHGGNGQRLAADMDSNGWPQTGRNKALKSIRKAHAIMIHGDQHVATLTHQGVDDWNDSGWSYAAPGIANGYPRLWDPLEPGKNRQPGSPKYTGEFLDGFKNKVTVWAANNRPDAYDPNANTDYKSMVERLQGTGSGYGIVRFDKNTLAATVENWEPMNKWKAGSRQSEGWPKTIPVADQYSRPAKGHLPSVLVSGAAGSTSNLQLVNESTGEVEYTLPAQAGTQASLKVFDKSARYTVLIRDKDGTELRKHTGLKAK